MAKKAKPPPAKKRSIANHKGKRRKNRNFAPRPKDQGEVPDTSDIPWFKTGT